MSNIAKTLASGFYAALFLASVAIPVNEARAQSLEWSGFSWDLKDTGTGTFGPGPNRWSARNVSVDSQGRLHMFIRRDPDGVWSCSELIMRDAIGYGTYTMVLGTPADRVHRQAVLGFFTWSNRRPNNEMDVEIASFRAPANLYHSLQPDTFDYTVGGSAWSRSEHTIVWSRGNVTITSIPLGSGGGAPIRSVFNRRVPRPTNTTTPRINWWLRDGQAPAGVNELEVVIERVSFVRS